MAPHEAIYLAYISQQNIDYKIQSEFEDFCETLPLDKFDVASVYRTGQWMSNDPDQLAQLRTYILDNFDHSVTISEPAPLYRVKLNKSVKVKGDYRRQTGGHAFAILEVAFSPHKSLKPYEPLTLEFSLEDTLHYDNYSLLQETLLRQLNNNLPYIFRSTLWGRLPFIGLHANIIGAKDHPADRFTIPAVVAFLKAIDSAMHEASTTLLEPVVEIKINCNSDHISRALYDLKARRDFSLSASTDGHIEGFIPMAGIMNYREELVTLTDAQADFSIEFHHYQPVPQAVAVQLAVGL